jgi:hypothetical protein
MFGMLPKLSSISTEIIIEQVICQQAEGVAEEWWNARAEQSNRRESGC